MLLGRAIKEQTQKFLTTKDAISDFRSGTFPSVLGDRRALLIWPIAIQKLACILLIYFVVFAHHQVDWKARLCSADGNFYLRLAAGWYSRGNAACAFYPLFPFLIRIIAPIMGGNIFAAGLLLANVFSIAGSFLFYEVVRARYGDLTALTTLALLLAFPGAMFFGLIYTESLFFFLTMLLFWGLWRQYPLLVCLSAFLLPLTRAVGIFLVLPLGWLLLEKIWGELRRQLDAPRESGVLACPATRRSIKGITNAVLLDVRSYAILSVFAGYGLYFLIMYQATGNPFEGFQAQQLYANQPSIANIFDIHGIWDAFLNGGHLHGQVDAILDRALFVLFLMTLPFTWRLDHSYFFYSLGVGLVPALSNWFLSYNRFIELSFPMFIVLGCQLQKPGKRWLLFCYLGVMAAIQMISLFRSLNFLWAG